MDELRQVAEQLAGEAAEFVRRRRREVFAGGAPTAAVRVKSTPTDPVTVVDTETEELVRRRLAELRRGDGVLGEAGGAGADALDGGTGNDTASYAGSSAGVNIQLQYGIVQGGDADGDTLTGIENLTGSAHGDTLTGDPSPNILSGLGGDDYLKGLNADDTLLGGDGNDWLYVDHLDTTIDGGADTDRLFMLTTSGANIDVAAASIEIATWVARGSGLRRRSVRKT